VDCSITFGFKLASLYDKSLDTVIIVFWQMNTLSQSLNKNVEIAVLILQRQDLLEKFVYMNF